MSIYVLDTNVFIESARRHYAFDLAPGFWQALQDRAESGHIRSIDRVRSELEIDDEIGPWIHSNFSKQFFTSDSTDVIEVYQQIITWVQSSGQFLDAAKSQFARGADGWLVAYAKVNDYVVVTQEVYAPDVRKKVPIPNICRKFDVTYVDTFQMLRNLGVRLG